LNGCKIGNLKCELKFPETLKVKQMRDKKQRDDLNRNFRLNELDE
jgi:hypothetical protein